MRLKMTLAAILVAMLAAFAGACGGGGGDPAETVEDFFAAISDGDGGTACDLVTEDGLASIGAELGAEGTDCEAAFEQAGPIIEQLNLELTNVETTEENGDTATVEATVNSELSGEQTDEIQLAMEDGEWKISGDASE